jgi:uncharacterized Zn-finger protein
MVANGIPYFHNNPGVGRVRIRVKKFLCAGDLPPFDHPHIYIDMGDDDENVCPYCGTLFAYDPALEAICEPAQCAFRPETAPEPVAPPGDISVVTAPRQPEIAAPPQPQPQPQVSARRAMSIETTSSGVAASFATEDEMRTALDRLRAADSAGLKAYTPMALEDDPGRSRVPLAMLICGLLGVCGMFAMETGANISSYPLDIGGRPKFSWPSFVPIAFEVGVLCAMLGGFFAYLIAARMPKLYDPADEFELMRDAMRDRWVIAMTAGDAQARERARQILERFDPRPEGERPG